MGDSRIHKATRRLPGDNAKWSLLIARLSSRVVPFLLYVLAKLASFANPPRNHHYAINMHLIHYHTRH